MAFSVVTGRPVLPLELDVLLLGFLDRRAGGRVVYEWFGRNLVLVYQLPSLMWQPLYFYYRQPELRWCFWDDVDDFDAFSEGVDLSSDSE